MREFIIEDWKECNRDKPSRVIDEANVCLSRHAAVCTIRRRDGGAYPSDAPGGTRRTFLLRLKLRKPNFIHFKQTKKNKNLKQGPLRRLAGAYG